MLRYCHGTSLLMQSVLAGIFPDFKKKIRSFSSALPSVQQLKKPSRKFIWEEGPSQMQYTRNESFMN